MSLDKSVTSFIAGTRIELKCESEGFPIPVLHWYKNNTPLKSGGKVNLTESTLIVSRADSFDKGTYKCT